jgi:hypothetical protein
MVMADLASTRFGRQGSSLGCAWAGGASELAFRGVLDAPSEVSASVNAITMIKDLSVVFFKGTPFRFRSGPAPESIWQVVD